MAKHTVLIAVVVDDKYTAQEVKKEIEHCASCCDSELFDTVSGVYANVPEAKQHTYVVWSEHKAGCATYEGLTAHEEGTGCSVSSLVYTSDIDAIIDAVDNECDIMLYYHQLTGE